MVMYFKSNKNQRLEYVSESITHKQKKYCLLSLLVQDFQSVLFLLFWAVSVSGNAVSACTRMEPIVYHARKLLEIYASVVIGLTSALSALQCISLTTKIKHAFHAS